MKIAWFTPYSASSAIGRYSRIVTAELAQRHEVEIWTFCHRELHPSPVPLHVLRSHTDISAAAMECYDICVYQMGNHWPFHGEIWRQSRRHPGIVVLHDRVMHSFFAAYFFEHLRSPTAYGKAMKIWHGRAGEAASLNAIAGVRPYPWEIDQVAAFPMLRGVTDGALGVVAHSEFVLNTVRPAYSGPTLALPLPYESPTAHRALLLSRADLCVGDDELLMITVGHVNPNKRVQEAIQAVGQLPLALKTRVVYAVLGPVEDHMRTMLTREAKDAGLGDILRLIGYTSDQQLASYIAHADLCVNLRYPNTEGASASTIEQMLAGKAVIANDTGWFAELPENVIRRVHTGDVMGLACAISELLTERDLRLDLGRCSKEYARRTFRSDGYADGLEAFVDSVLRLKPVTSFVDSVAERLHAMGVPPDDALTRSVAERSSSLFAPRRL